MISPFIRLYSIFTGKRWGQSSSSCIQRPWRLKVALIGLVLLENRLERVIHCFIWFEVAI